MATLKSLANQAIQGQEKALQVVTKHASAERLESIELIPLERAHTRFPEHLAALQGELIAGLAEIVEKQDARITALEEAAKPASTTRKAAKKS